MFGKFLGFINLSKSISRLVLSLTGGIAAHSIARGRSLGSTLISA